MFVSECVCVLIDNFSSNGDHDDGGGGGEDVN